MYTHQMRTNYGKRGDFWSHAERQDDGCLLWRGGGGTYGKTSVRTQDGVRQLGAHRRAWELTHGDIPEGMLVLHRCDVPRCINPEHLFLGTHKDNSADMVAKGRTNTPSRRGPCNGRVKLTPANVASIRSEYANGARQVDLAAKYGVKQPQISRIVRMTSYIEEYDA